MEQQSRSFTVGKILAPLLSFTMPILLAMFLQAMYGAVDLLVVGRFGTSADVSAVSTGSQIMQSVTFCISSIAMGSTVLLGQKIGQKQPKEAGEVVGASIALFAAVGLLVAAVMTLCATPLAQLMRAPAEAFSETAAYIRICSSGFVFITAYNVLGSVFRGIGDAKTPLLTVAIACAVNIAGDLLLVAVFKLAAAGAAIATVAAQAVSVAVSLAIVRKRGLPIRFARRDVRFSWPWIPKILALGCPIALQDLLVSVSFLVILAIVNSLGLIASAAIGVSEKLCAFIMLFPSSFMQSMSAFVAQNIGAGKPDRARRAMRCGMAASLAMGAALACLAFFQGGLLASIFTKDAAVATAAHSYLRAYAIDTLLVSFLFCFVGYFNGCGKTAFVMLQGIAGAFLIRIPISFLMREIGGGSLFLIGLATPCSSAVQILLCLIYYRHLQKRAVPGV